MTQESAALERPLLIVDLEATCWERSEHRAENMETIEIGALLVDPLRPDEAPREFQRLVRPTLRPQLSRFCIELTGIPQSEVDAAADFATVFASFVEWIGAPQAVRFASWGRYDRRQLELDCSRHGAAYPFGEEHLNLKHWAAARLGVRPGGLAQAVARLGLTFEGRHHRGLDDARNIWRVTRRAAGDDLRALARGEP
jgi:inhibitor of KinA sporulation pathway (predicted exonuclease)